MTDLPVLYHAPGTCSEAVLIAAREGAVDLSVEPVDFREKTFDGGRSFLKVNPLGQVSTLRLPGGEQLTENTAILMWIQARSEMAGFHRAPDHADYFQILRWIGFTATELHKQLFRIVFYSEATDAVKDRFRGLVPARFELLNQHLRGREFLVGGSFSAADAYMVWALALSPKAGVSMAGYAHLQAYRRRMMSRPAAAAVLG